MSYFNNETCFEFGQGFGQGFTVTPNEILNDNNLSYKALGIYVQILQYQNSKDHKIYMSTLQKLKSDGETSVRNGMKELIKRGYIERIELRNMKGHLKGCKYIVHVRPIEITTNEPKRDNLVSDNLVSDNHVVINKIGLKENKKKENKDVEDEQIIHTDKVIELYKSFKIEKRVMPHTLKLLKQYADYFSLEVLEQIFIQASEESVNKKYNYIKTMLEDYFDNKIFTINDLVQYNQKFKESKNKNIVKKTTKNNTNVPTVKTRFHNINQTFNKYTPDELEKILQESQKGKFNTEWK